MSDKAYFDPETGKAVGGTEKAKTYFDPDTGRPADEDSSKPKQDYLPYPHLEVVRPEHFDPSTTEGKINLGLAGASGVAALGGPMAAAGTVLRYLVPAWAGGKAGREIGGAIGGSKGAAVGNVLGSVAGGLGGPGVVEAALGKIGGGLAARAAAAAPQTVGALAGAAAPAAEAAAPSTVASMMSEAAPAAAPAANRLSAIRDFVKTAVPQAKIGQKIHVLLDEAGNAIKVLTPGEASAVPEALKTWIKAGF